MLGSKIWGIIQLVAAGIWVYHTIEYTTGSYNPDTITIVIAFVVTALWLFTGAIKSYFKEEL